MTWKETQVPYFEVLYENGEHSIAEYEDENEAVSAVTAHHERAVKGEPAMLDTGDSRMPPAVRVVKVLMYDAHPADWMVEQTASADEIIARVKELTKGEDVVFVPDAVSHLRSMTNAFKDDPGGNADSNYRAEPVKELKLPFADK